MKPSIPLLVAIFLLISFQLEAQHELWGMTFEGGGAHGVIFKTDSSGGNYSVEYMFRTEERNPKGSLIKASNGKYYGMSDGGGLYGLGTIFEYDYSTDSVKVLHDFDGAATGAHPKGNLLQASNGKFYGMTLEGGIYGLGYGVLFEYDLSDSSFTKHHDFSDAGTGRYPFGNLIEAANGKLYGLNNASGGGSTGSGILFEFDMSTGILTKLHTFGTNPDGANPYGSLLEASNGLLYGTTRWGGASNQGTVFEYNTTTATYTSLHGFDGITGQGPMGTLIQAKNGKLYGMFNEGSGSSYVGGIFEYDTVEDTLIKSMDLLLGTSTGGWPERCNLVEGDSNQFFGMTNRGGAVDDGVIFRFDNSSVTYTNVHDFNFNDATNANVFGTLMESVPGKYLGMTNLGGDANLGMIFELETLTGTVNTRYSFDDYSTGRLPKGSLMAASNGKFYGMTVAGGHYNLGTLFEFDPFTGTYKKLHDFDGAATGANPNCTLIEASNGKFYGVTKWGGTSDGQGTLFEFDPATGTVTKKYDFGYAPAPGRPIGGLVEASNGKLYGMTYYGGEGNKGTIYEYDIPTNTFTKKYVFINANGFAPEGGMIETSPGILYGMARAGGANNYGSLFRYHIDSNKVTVRHDFHNNTSGREPMGDLIMGSNGKLYGMTSNGGSNGSGWGTIIEFEIGTGNLNVLYSFTVATDGRFPHGSLLESSNGKLYGMTSYGGTAGYGDRGVLFEFDPSSSTYVKKVDFDDDLGQKPEYTFLIKVLVHADWTGAVSTDWHNPANWLQNDVPSAFTEVVIPDVSGASGRFPALNSNVRVRDLTIEPGASIDIQNGINLLVGRDGSGN